MSVQRDTTKAHKDDAWINLKGGKHLWGSQTIVFWVLKHHHPHPPPPSPEEPAIDYPLMMECKTTEKLLLITLQNRIFAQQLSKLHCAILTNSVWHPYTKIYRNSNNKRGIFSIMERGTNMYTRNHVTLYLRASEVLNTSWPYSGLL